MTDWTSDCGTVRLICGDCLEVLPTLEAGIVDACVTDPPYGIDYQSARRTDSTKWKPKIANDTRPFIWWLPQSLRVARDPAAMLCFCRWDVQESFRLAIEWAGWSVESQVIWDRELHGMGDLNGEPSPRHDVIWFASNGRFTFHGPRPATVIRSMRLSGDQLTHPNEKPVDLLEQLVESYCEPSGVALDVCMGSGTTGVACIRTGRRFIGIELEPRYFEIAKRRCQDELRRVKFLEPEPQPPRQLELLT